MSGVLFAFQRTDHTNLQTKPSFYCSFDFPNFVPPRLAKTTSRSPFISPVHRVQCIAAGPPRTVDMHTLQKRIDAVHDKMPDACIRIPEDIPEIHVESHFSALGSNPRVTQGPRSDMPTDIHNLTSMILTSYLLYSPQLKPSI